MTDQMTDERRAELAALDTRQGIHRLGPPIEHMTQKEVRAEIEGRGMSARFSAETGEWRVTFPAGVLRDEGEREAVAYYTTDARAAFDTAIAMQVEREMQIEGKRVGYTAADEARDLARFEAAEQIEGGNRTYRVAPHAAEAVRDLAALLPNAERQPLHREGEPSEAEITAHMMTGEDRPSPFALAAARLATPEAQAARQAEHGNRASIERDDFSL